MFLRKRDSLFVAAAFALLAVPCAWGQSPEEIQKMEQAMPKTVTVKPAKAHKVLIFDLAKGFKHSSIPYAAKAFQVMAEKTGAFSADVTSDVAALKAENLKNYDAIILDNNTGEVFDTPEIQQSLVDFVKQGKGLVGVHAATDCCYNWPEYGEMLGGWFNAHPWTSKETVVVKFEEPDHPLVKAFAGKELTVTDEIYQFKDPYSRAKLRVLANLDTDKIDMTKPAIKRTDKDFAVSWIHPYGKGRVFYCSLGHNHEIFWTPSILQHYLDGIQYALGDLKVDDEPSQKVAGELLKKAFPRALAETTSYNYDAVKNLTALDEMIRQSNAYPELRREFASQIAAVLTNPMGNVTVAAKQYLARKLSEIGSDKEAVSLAPMLRDKDPRVAELARYTLERIPGQSVNRVLRSALEETRGSVAIGIINSLGLRRDPLAVKLLVREMREAAEAAEQEVKTLESLDLPAQNESVKGVRELVQGKANAVAEACVTALGHIGNAEASRALSEYAPKCPEALRARLADARLVCADRLLAEGQQVAAVTVYRELCADSQPLFARVPAFMALVRASDAVGRALAVDTLLNDKSPLRQAATQLVLQMKQPEVTAQLTAKLADQTTPTQVLVLSVLGARGDAGAREAALQKASDSEPEVRLAAINALASLGNGSCVDVLAQAASEKSGKAREAARTSLAKLPASDVNQAIVAAYGQYAAKEDDGQAARVRVELVKALLARHAVACMPTLNQAAADKDASVQVAAFAALGEFAKAEDMAKLVELLLGTSSEKARQEAEKAVVAVSHKIADASKRADAVVAALPNAKSVEGKAALLRILGKVGSDKALEVLREAKAKEQDAALQDAVVRALSDFPSNKALEDVRQIAREGQSDTHKVLALRGFARMIAEPSDRPADKTVAYCKEALELAKRPEDKKTVLGELGGVSQPEVLSLVAPCVDDKEIAEEAMAAVLKLAPEVYAFVPEDASKALSKIQEKGSEGQKKQAEKLLKQLQSENNGLICGWRVAGPYKADGKPVEELIDCAFAPETSSSEQISWGYASVGGGKAKQADMVDLKKLMGGKDRVAYLRARIWSPEEQQAQLLMGSDDGLRAWLNGQIVYSHASSRAFKAEQDKVSVKLNKGCNYLMLKVTQGGKEWGAAARVVSEKGEAIKDLKSDALQVEDNAKFVAQSAQAQK